mgnify:CR=1 FL=1
MIVLDEEEAIKIKMEKIKKYLRECEEYDLAPWEEDQLSEEYHKLKEQLKNNQQNK